MSSVAEQLRLAREAQGLSLRDLAEMTKIRTDHLEALESSNFDPFPAPVYIRGSVRTCATFLHMDVPAVLATLDAELAKLPEFSSPPSLTGGQRGPLDWLTYHLSLVNWRVLSVVGGTAALLLGGYYGWHAWSQRLREDPLSRLGPGVHKPAAISEGDILSIPTNAPAAASRPTPAPAPSPRPSPPQRNSPNRR